MDLDDRPADSELAILNSNYARPAEEKGDILLFSLRAPVGNGSMRLCLARPVHLLAAFVTT